MNSSVILKLRRGSLLVQRMLGRHGTRLEIGTAEDVADLEAMERRWKAEERSGRPASESIPQYRASESPAAAFDDSLTPKPSRRAHAYHQRPSTPPPPPQL